MIYFAKYCCWLIENGQAVVGFLSIMVCEEMKNICCTHDGQPYVTWFTCIDDVQSEEMEAIFLTVEYTTEEYVLIT